MDHIIHTENKKIKGGKRPPLKQIKMKHLPFEFNGTTISDATTDESGRFSVDPVEHYGQDFLNAYQCQLVVVL